MTKVVSLRSWGASVVRALDRVFLIVFARYRRKLGDANVEFAWRRASNMMSGYLLWPTASVTAILVTLVYSLVGFGFQGEYRRLMQIAGAVSALLMVFALNRHFKGFLLAPPRLTPSEAPKEARLLFWFRVLSVCTFVLTCLMFFVT
ncbi:MAG: hypothetical protein ACRD3W_32570 [Terriglobales bacterium]